MALDPDSSSCQDKTSYHSAGPKQSVCGWYPFFAIRFGEVHTVVHLYPPHSIVYMTLLMYIRFISPKSKLIMFVPNMSVNTYISDYLVAYNSSLNFFWLKSFVHFFPLLMLLLTHVLNRALQFSPSLWIFYKKIILYQFATTRNSH